MECFFCCTRYVWFYFLNRLLVAAAFTSYKTDTRKRINQTMHLRNRSLRRAFSVLSRVDDDYAFDKTTAGKNAIFPGENMHIDNDSTQKHVAKSSGNLVTLGQWIKLRMFTNYSRHYFLQHALRMTLKANKEKLAMPHSPHLLLKAKPRYCSIVLTMTIVVKLTNISLLTFATI